MTRPDPPELTEEQRALGYRWEASREPDFLHWTTDRPTLRSGRPAANRCRQAGPDQRLPARAGRAARRPSCGRDAVAWMDRGVRWHNWYAYCGDHLYGRWIEDGKIMWWRLAGPDKAG